MQLRISEEITFRKLEVLLAYLEAGSLARAAELLDVSTVSVHRALHSLEAGMHCSLFRHEGRNLVPTEAAQVLADAARGLLADMHLAIRTTREAAGYSAGRLRIGSLFSLTASTVPEVLRGIKLRRPELQLELVPGSNDDLLNKLRQAEVDAILTALPESDPEIVSISLFEDDIFFAAPLGSAYADKACIDLRHCAGERFVTLSAGFATYRGFMEAFRIAGFEPTVSMRVDDIYTLMNLVSGGIGCTLLPGRVRGVVGQRLLMIPLDARYAMRQTISLSFRRVRERDPNLLALAAACRMATAVE
jgi:LysR family malonate utilization transcriptional regulator